jgi:hypothetical protein
MVWGKKKKHKNLRKKKNRPRIKIAKTENDFIDHSKWIFDNIK